MREIQYFSIKFLRHEWVNWRMNGMAWNRINKGAKLLLQSQYAKVADREATRIVPNTQHSAMEY